jgi:hypothetical protein
MCIRVNGAEDFATRKTSQHKGKIHRFGHVGSEALICLAV